MKFQEGGKELPFEKLLKREQLADGSFISYSSANRKFHKALKLHTTFFASLILGCLSQVDETPTLRQVKKRAANFLLTQQSDHGSFNYWARGSKEETQKPYPDDLDDTFCALTALYRYDPELIGGRSLARITYLLALTEAEVGGPYRTWLVDKDTPRIWQDVDLAVNANIAYFLSLQDIQLPKVNSFIQKAISQNKISSPYYPSSYPLAYFISRSFREQSLVKLLLSKRVKDHWENPLSSALAISSLLNLGYRDLSREIDYLKKASWTPLPFCFDPAKRGKSYYAGSAALTASFCLEAITAYQKNSQVVIPSPNGIICQKIEKTIRDRFSKLKPSLKVPALRALKKILARDQDFQIRLLPYFFKNALNNADQVSDELIIELGVANVFGWVAYTIFDDFLDLEGEMAQLSVATLCLREVSRIFTNLEGFRDIFSQIMDLVDQANAWEIEYCRSREELEIPDYGDYGVLADRSMGHSLGPLAIMNRLGYKAHSKEVRYFLSFFKHYLIARQLNDDAHDWEEDLKRGIANSVAARLLRRAKLKGEIDYRKLEQLFWHSEIDKICDLILGHARLARRYLSKMTILANAQYFDKILDHIEITAGEALTEREKAITFIRELSVGKAT